MAVEYGGVEGVELTAEAGTREVMEKADVPNVGQQHCALPGSGQNHKMNL